MLEDASEVMRRTDDNRKITLLVDLIQIHGTMNRKSNTKMN